MEENQDWYQSEYAAHFGVSRGQISKVLSRLGITRKKKSLTYLEQDEKKVLEFEKDFKELQEQQTEALGVAPQIVYVDESAIKQSVTREYGYGTKGEKVLGKINGKRVKNVNIVAGIAGKEILAPFTFDGTMDTDLFYAYLEFVLLPVVCFGAMIVIDNAPYHVRGVAPPLSRNERID